MLFLAISIIIAGALIMYFMIKYRNRFAVGVDAFEGCEKDAEKAMRNMVEAWSDYDLCAQALSSLIGIIFKEALINIFERG